jgi:hypothetical protein
MRQRLVRIQPFGTGARAQYSNSRSLSIKMRENEWSTDGTVSKTF